MNPWSPDYQDLPGHHTKPETLQFHPGQVALLEAWVSPRHGMAREIGGSFCDYPGPYILLHPQDPLWTTMTRLIEPKPLEYITPSILHIRTRNRLGYVWDQVGDWVFTPVQDNDAINLALHLSWVQGLRLDLYLETFIAARLLDRFPVWDNLLVTSSG